MVLKSPLCQHEQGGMNESSFLSLQPMLPSPAEIQVREIASKIGLLEDSKLLTEVCHNMRKEYVVEEWQLPDLDSRQWEKMVAPIGLAVAVKHISTYRLREKESLLQFQERYSNNNKQAYSDIRQKEKELQIKEKEENLLVSSYYHEDLAKTTASSSWSSKQKDETEISPKIKSDVDDDALGSKLGGNIVEIEAHTASIDTSTLTTDDEEIKDEPNEKGEVATKSENDQIGERNHHSLASDDVEKKIDFSDEDCSSDWLKLEMIGTVREEALEREEEFERRAESRTALPITDSDNIDDHNGSIDLMIKPTSSKMEEVSQANIEPVNGIERKISRPFETKMKATHVEAEPVNTLELDNSMPSVFDRNEEEKAQAGIEPINIIEAEIPATIKRAQAKTEPSHGLQLESSTSPVNLDREQESSQMKTKFTESTDSDSVTIPKCIEEKEIPHVDNDKGNRRDSVTTSMHVEKHLGKDVDTSEREGIPETNSSDSESDDNTDIFSGIGNSASFSEDEIDHRLADKEKSQLDYLLDPLELTEDTAISSMSNPETNLLQFPDNGADDITVHVSNVSPECRKLASKRKKKRNKYRHEYDRASHDTSSFEIETAALQHILVELPDDDHRSILSQLMIMTNARDKTSRSNLALQVQDALVALIEKNEMDVEPAKAVQLIFHLSRLKKPYRTIFGKSLFKAMSKSYKRAEKLKERNSPENKGEKNAIADKKKYVQDEQGTNQKGVIEDHKSLVDNVQPQI